MVSTMRINGVLYHGKKRDRESLILTGESRRPVPAATRYCRGPGHLQPPSTAKKVRTRGSTKPRTSSILLPIHAARALGYGLWIPEDRRTLPVSARGLSSEGRLKHVQRYACQPPWLILSSDP